VRILVINDNAGRLAMCQHVLESRGHEVEATTEVNAVTATVARFQPDVLVMSSLDQIALEAKRLGARAFLRKPFVEGDLVAAVEALS
jgi:CheY-like chemotaxis protein